MFDSTPGYVIQVSLVRWLTFSTSEEFFKTRSCAFYFTVFIFESQYILSFGLPTCSYHIPSLLKNMC